MERTDQRTPGLVTLMAACPLMRPKVRAYSHQGHGPRADLQAGYISATSTPHAQSVAKRSRSIHPYIRVRLRRDEPALNVRLQPKSCHPAYARFVPGAAIPAGGPALNFSPGRGLLRELLSHA